MPECILRISLAHSCFRGLIFNIYLSNDLTSVLKWFKLQLTDSLLSTVTVNQAVSKTNRKYSEIKEKRPPSLLVCWMTFSLLYIVPLHFYNGYFHTLIRILSVISFQCSELVKFT